MATAMTATGQTQDDEHPDRAAVLNSTIPPAPGGAAPLPQAGATPGAEAPPLDRTMDTSSTSTATGTTASNTTGSTTGTNTGESQNVEHGELSPEQVANMNAQDDNLDERTGLQAQQNTFASQAAQAQADAAPEQARIQAEHAARVAEITARGQDELQQAERQSKYDEERWSQLKPHEYWSQKSTLSKVAAGIGIMFGALGANGGQNQALTIIENNINRDMDQQKMELEQLRARAERSSRIPASVREDIANQLKQLDLKKAAALDSVAAQIQAKIAAQGPQKASVEGQQAVAKLKQEALALRAKDLEATKRRISDGTTKAISESQNQARTFGSSKTSTVGTSNSTVRDEAANGKKGGPGVLYGPNGEVVAQVPSPAVAGRANDQVGNYRRLMSQIDGLLKSYDDNGVVVPYVSEEAHSREAQLGALQSNLKNWLKLNMRGKGVEVLEDMTSTPAQNWTSAGAGKLEQLRKTLTEEMGAMLAKSGINPKILSALNGETPPPEVYQKVGPDGKMHYFRRKLEGTSVAPTEPPPFDQGGSDGEEK